MLQKRYTILLADRTTGAVRRLTVSIRTVLLLFGSVALVSMLEQMKQVLKPGGKDFVKTHPGPGMAGNFAIRNSAADADDHGNNWQGRGWRSRFDYKCE